MQKFIRDISWSILAFVVIIICIESIQFLIPDSYTYKRHYVETHREDISVLLLGHSHVLRGVNPHMLGDSVFNFSESGRWIYYDAKIAERYIPSMTNLRLVVYPIGYDMPMGYLSSHYEHDHPDFDDNHDYNIHKYAKYMNIPYDQWPMRITAYSAFISGYLAIEEFFANHLDCDSLGFEVLDSTIHCSPEWDKFHLPHLADNELCDTSHNSIYLKEYIDCLINIAHVCYINNVRFVAITTPCHPNYIEKTCPKGIENLTYIVNEVSKHYPIEYYNYIADEEFRSDTFYYDCSHLNYYGAEKFTLRLKKDLRL